MSARIVKTGTIGGRGFCVVRRGDANAWPMCLGEQFQLFGHGIIGRGWLCGYVDATGSRFDGIDDEDDPAFAGLGVEITYPGQGVPGCDGAPSTGWWIGFDTAHPDMEDETPESVEETIRGLVRAMGEEVRT